MKRQYVYFIAAALIAGANAWASTTGMPWELGTGLLGNSLTKFVAPTVAVAGGGIALLDWHRGGGSVSHVGGTAFVAAIGGLAASLWTPAMSLMGVTAATV